MPWTARAVYRCALNRISGANLGYGVSVLWINNSLFVLIAPAAGINTTQMSFVYPDTGIMGFGPSNVDENTIAMGRVTVPSPLQDNESIAVEPYGPPLNVGGTNSASIGGLVAMAVGREPVAANSYAGAVVVTNNTGKNATETTTDPANTPGTIVRPSMDWSTETSLGAGDGNWADNNDPFNSQNGNPVVGLNTIPGFGSTSNFFTLMDTGTTGNSIVLQQYEEVPPGGTYNATIHHSTTFAGYAGSMSGMDGLQGQILTCSPVISGQLMILSDTAASFLTISAANQSPQTLEPFFSITYHTDTGSELEYYASTKSSTLGGSKLWSVYFTPPALTTCSVAKSVLDLVLTFTLAGAAAFKVSKDGGSFTTRVSPWTDTGAASTGHSYIVRAYDAAGNIIAQGQVTWSADDLPRRMLALAAL
jgi:hypothetical protein